MAAQVLYLDEDSLWRQGCERVVVINAQVLYLDEDSLWLDDPLELQWHFEEMHRRGATWGLAEEAAAGPNWYTKGGRQWYLHSDCGDVSLWS